MGKAILVILWVCGIILAEGFLSTAVAIFVPLWAWVVAIHHFLIVFGLS